LTLGAKTGTCAKLRGRFCSFFSYGAKIATLRKLGAKTVIKHFKNNKIRQKKLKLIFFKMIFINNKQTKITSVFCYKSISFN